jgi:hypothetical protein
MLQMVNSMATMRGKIKEVMCPIIQFGIEFIHPAVTANDINENLDLYSLIHPNRFHCLVCV